MIEFKSKKHIAFYVVFCDFWSKSMIPVPKFPAFDRHPLFLCDSLVVICKGKQWIRVLQSKKSNLKK